jgi:hypothetical protein
VAAFAALERKIAELETTPPWAGLSNAESNQLDQQYAVQLLTHQRQRFEVVLAAKNLELDGFRQQVDALLVAAQQLRG